MKTCTRCKIAKDSSEFHNSKRSKDGLTSHCKQCNREYGNARYHKNNPSAKQQKDKQPWITLICKRKSESESDFVYQGHGICLKREDMYFTLLLVFMVILTIAKMYQP